jgi:hypothetical protein
MFTRQIASAKDDAGPATWSGEEASRRPLFRPTQTPGTYRLPHDVIGRLRASLAAFRNAERAFTLATFLGRYWSSRARMARPFPIDRRALADREDLGLTEAQIRGALRSLELVGFLNRGEPPAGSTYKPTPEGLHRKPILFGFGAEFGPAFAAANARAERARGRQGDRRATTALSFSNSPKYKAYTGTVVLMGEVTKKAAERQRVARPVETDPALEHALRKLGEAAGFVAESPTRRR